MAVSDEVANPGASDYAPPVVASEAETDSGNESLATGGRAARASVSASELARRQEWGRQWGQHARETAAKLPKE